jgi:hypothetical protein
MIHFAHSNNKSSQLNVSGRCARRRSLTIQANRLLEVEIINTRAQHDIYGKEVQNLQHKLRRRWSNWAVGCDR